MQWLASKFKSKGIDLAFNVLDVGAVPVEGEAEPFHRLLKVFPSSRISALELEPQVCEGLNRSAPVGIRYYPCALGKTEEKRPLYETANPMCSSLYRPDERYADLFNNLDDTRLKRISEITTVSLDRFIQEHALGAIDFIKIDVQGAELDVFQGGKGMLHNVLSIVCEVEFVAMYRGQPLFGDVDAYLRDHDITFHKFLGMAGRVMKPLTAHGHPNYPVQYLWSDALFVRDLFKLDELHGDQLLKLAVLLDLYDSNDVALHALRTYDVVRGTDFGSAYLDHLNAAGTWKTRMPGEIKQP